MDRPTWQRHAACRGMGTDHFYPEGKGDSITLYGHARRLCAECPVVSPCLDEALADGDVEFGMRGGLTPKERKRALRQRRGLPELSPAPERRAPAVCGTVGGYSAHRRRGETPCDVCKAARSRHDSAYLPRRLAARRRRRREAREAKAMTVVERINQDDGCVVCADQPGSDWRTRR